MRRVATTNTGIYPHSLVHGNLIERIHSLHKQEQRVIAPVMAQVGNQHELSEGEQRFINERGRKQGGGHGRRRATKLKQVRDQRFCPAAHLCTGRTSFSRRSTSASLEGSSPSPLCTVAAAISAQIFSSIHPLCTPLCAASLPLSPYGAPAIMEAGLKTRAVCWLLAPLPGTV